MPRHYARMQACRTCLPSLTAYLVLKRATGSARTVGRGERPSGEASTLLLPQ